MSIRNITDENRVEFKQNYLPHNEFRVCGSDEKPYADPRDHEFPVPLAFIVDAGLRFPLEPLLVGLIRRTRIPLHVWTINSIRVVLGVCKLNHLLRLNLGLAELFYCYSVSAFGTKFYLKARSADRSLVLALPSSNKDKTTEVLAVSGVISSQPGQEVPISFGEDPAWQVPVSSLGEINAVHINLALNHVRYKLDDPLGKQHRAAHRLLGYKESETSFTTKTIKIPDWIGPEPEEREKFLLFYEHRVRNSFARSYRKRLEEKARGPEVDLEAIEARTTIAEAERRRALLDLTALNPVQQVEAEVVEEAVAEGDIGAEEEPSSSGREFEAPDPDDWDSHFQTMSSFEIPDLLKIARRKGGASGSSSTAPTSKAAPSEGISVATPPASVTPIASEVLPLGPLEKEKSFVGEKRPRGSLPAEARAKKHKGAPPPTGFCWAPDFSKAPVNFGRPLVQDRVEALKFVSAILPPKDIEFLDNSSLEQLSASGSIDAMSALFKIMRVTQLQAGEAAKKASLEKAAHDADQAAAQARAEAISAKSKLDETTSKASKLADDLKAAEARVKDLEKEKKMEKDRADAAELKVSLSESKQQEAVQNACAELQSKLSQAFGNQLNVYSELAYEVGFVKALDALSVPSDHVLRGSITVADDFWDVMEARAEADNALKNGGAIASVSQAPPLIPEVQVTGASGSGLDAAREEEVLAELDAEVAAEKQADESAIV